MAQKKSSNAGAIIASLAGITAAAIGGYYLYGHEDAEKNRAKVRGWMLRAKGDVLDELEKVGEVTESAYAKAVDAVTTKYKELRNIEPDELEKFMSEMKAHWQGIKKTLSKTSPAKKAVAKKPSKKAKNE